MRVDMNETLPPYSVAAFNNAANLENKIHDDEVASSYGFSGALVPGAAVFGYMAHQPVALWGREWLARGTAECRFLKPVYDGASASVTAIHTGSNGIHIDLHSQDRLCASSSATLSDSENPPKVGAWALSSPPPLHQRPAADLESLAAGSVLCTAPLLATKELASEWLADVRETDPLYVSDGLMHPTSLLRLCNWTLIQNVLLGPWIHTGSRIRNFAAMPIGSSLVARGVVHRNYEHKGHRLVDIDVLIVIDEKIAAARIMHTAIYLPRQTHA